MKTHVKVILPLVLGFATASLARADKIFEVIATTPGQSGQEQYTKFEDVFDAVQSDNLNRIISTYTETSAASVVMNVRGLPAIAQYTANSTVLTFQVPSLDIYETFDGVDRDDSEEQFQDYIKRNGSGILTRMLQAMVETTAIDPVAGNPNSLLAQMGGTDFSMGTDLNVGPAGSPGTVSKDSTQASAMSIGTSAGYYGAGDYDHDVVSIPIEYTHYMEDPRQQLRISAPLTYIDTEGSASYNGSFGVGYRFPINDNWSLTPALRLGILGSVDVGSAAIVYSGSLSSNYTLSFDNLELSIGNMYGYYTTQSIDAGDYEVDYDLTNQMTKNGVGLQGATAYKLFQQPTSWQFVVANSYFWGDELFIDSYYDVALSWGTSLTESSNLFNSMRFGLTYTFDGDDYDGFRVNFGYTF